MLRSLVGSEMCIRDRFGLVNPIALLKVLKYGDKQIVQEAAYQERNEKVMAELVAAAKASGSDVPRPTAEYQDVLERRSYVMEYRLSLIHI